ncbi:MAG: EAL domain-containing protein [Reinekea sp.]|nr:EAL domain-containing protein [Reinekea sp.]
MAISFRNRLLASFILLLGLALFTTTWAVLRAVDNTARANAERELLVAERVFDTLLDENSRQLTDRTALLAEDFGFRQAIATNEEETIISALVNHGERISADLMLLMSPQGEVLISTHDLGVTQAALQQKIKGQSQPFNDLAVTEHKPFQLVMVPVNAPELIAWVGVGFAIDSDLVTSFRDLTKADVSLLFQDDLNRATETVSTLDDEFTRLATAPVSFDTTVQQFTAGLADSEWLSHNTTLLDREPQQMSLVMSVSLREAVAAYQNLQTQMLSIAAAVLLLAVIASVFIAGTVTKPIGVLVQAARRIAKGDYEKRLSIPGKTEFNELGDTLNQMQRDIQDREQRITFQAQHDMLTGLPNRHHMATLMQNRLIASRVTPFAAVLIKITNAESLGDVYGTAIMDRVLKLAAQRLKSALLAEDTVGLIASDEFLVLSDVRPQAPLESRLDLLTSTFAQPLHCNDIEFTLNIRMGVVRCPEQADNYEDMLRRSHIALSEARLANNRQCIYSPGLEEQYLRKLKVTQRLQQAISEQSFTLLFQPQLDLHGRRIHSAEALIRWHDQELGPVYPDEFIPLAENSGDITLITDWVFSEALSQLERWHQAGFDMGVSINLSAKDILKDDFIDRVIKLIQTRDIDPKQLMLEVTESAFVEDMDRALHNLGRLYDAGAHLAMDDFGTGFSSLAQLKVMPVHELKIDKSFVLRLDQDQDDQKIVRSTIDMAHHLGLSVIAEGVENGASMALLKQMQCDAIQGYFLSKPMSSADMLNWLAQFQYQQLESSHV